jgi:hypothetical protein
LNSTVLALHRIFREIVPRFGFTHAKVYSCLLSAEAKSARQIIQETEIARPIVYRVLKDLIIFGLITETKGSPAVFFAERPVQKAKKLINKRKKELDLRAVELKKIAGCSSGVSEDIFFVCLSGAGKKLLDRQTRAELKDKNKLLEIKRTAEKQLLDLDKSNLKPWQLL